MQLKFCININKTLEVIRILVMTVFLCHPVYELNVHYELVPPPNSWTDLLLA